MRKLVLASVMLAIVAVASQRTRSMTSSKGGIG